jgi:hypothetical protein
MKMLKLITILLIIWGCRAEKTEDKKEIPPALQYPQTSNTVQNATPIQEQEQQGQVDRTDEIYSEIKDVFSGSWMDSGDVIDGEREMSWGTVPFANQFYLIIDFQNGNHIIINGSSEGGKEGFDDYIGDVLKIEKEQANTYRLTFKDKLDTFNPNRKHEIVLRYNPENDTMTIIGYSDDVYENPSEMIRVSEPISP